MSVYLFPGERSGAQPLSPPVVAPTGSLGSPSEAKEDEKEEEGDGDTLDSDEFCILDAPGLGVPVCGGQVGQAKKWRERVAQSCAPLEPLLREVWEAGKVSWGGMPGLQALRSKWIFRGREKSWCPWQRNWDMELEGRATGWPLGG